MSNQSPDYNSKSKQYISSQQNAFKSTLNYFSYFNQKPSLNQDHKSNALIIKQSKTCEIDQKSQDGSNKSWFSDEKKMAMSNSRKTRAQKKSKQRCINTISSNSLRDLKQCIKSLFLYNHQIYAKIQFFLREHQIKSQIWGIDAILFYVLHLKDVTKQISEQKYTTLLNLLVSKLELKKQNTKQIQSKQRFNFYIQHVIQYKHANFDQFWDFQFQRKINKFYSSLVSRRRIQVKNAMEKVQQIINSLGKNFQQNQFQNQMAEDLNAQDDQNFCQQIFKCENENENQYILDMDDQFDNFFK